MKKFTSLILIAILFVNCKVDDDCEGLLDMPPPLFISIEVLDKLTEENLFANETYRRSELRVLM